MRSQRPPVVMRLLAVDVEFTASVYTGVMRIPRTDVS